MSWLIHIQQVIKGMVIFLAVGIEITSIHGNNAPMSEMLGQNDQRGVSKIHWQIFIRAHEDRHTRQF